jgi:plasmid stabilization system protein ParE
MNYTVIWRQQALDKLADLWNNAADPNAVAAASDRIDFLLERDPLNQGESRSGNVRILFERSLAVLYGVDVRNRRVLVVNVGPAGRP